MYYSMPSTQRGLAFSAPAPNTLQTLRRSAKPPNHTSSRLCVPFSPQVRRSTTARACLSRFQTDVHLASISGGTDIIHACPGQSQLPVHTGSCSVRVWVYGVLGRQPTDSHWSARRTGVHQAAFSTDRFLNDDKHKKFRSAYFDDRPGIWTRGLRRADLIWGLHHSRSQ